jgi:hypothetical protein
MRVFALTMICAAAAGCGTSPGPEEAVRLWIRDAETAVGNRDRGALMEMIAERYADARGNDKEEVEQKLRLWFLRSQNIVLASKIDSVTVMGDTAAQVLLTAGMAGTGDGILGLTADAYRFELQLENDGNAWRLIGARWGEVGTDLR